MKDTTRNHQSKESLVTLRSHGNRDLHRRLPSGFALVVSLTMMVLLTIVAIGLLSLSAVSLRSAGQTSAQAEAQANARLALMIAIGELQKQMGPDQRISANGAILSESSVANPHWLGTWDSWIAGPVNADNVNPNYPNITSLSSHSTINPPAPPEPGVMAPSYLPGRNDYFRSWLLSLDSSDATDITAPNRDLNGERIPSAPEPGEPAKAIQLVAEGSTAEPADYVSARLIHVMDNNDEAIRGRYAWWVGDESQKARVMHDSYHGDTLSDAERIFRSQSPASTGTNTIPGLTALDPSQQARLEGLPSLATLDLVPGTQEIGTLRPSQKNFHDISLFSRAVLADVREGGLKRDLSTLLERPIDPDEASNEFMLYKFDVKDAWANSHSADLPNTPQEAVPIQDLAAFYQLYDQSRKGGIMYHSSQLPNSIQVTTPDYGNHSTFATRYQREYTTLYRNPVPIKVQFLISLQADPITQEDRNYEHNAQIPAEDTHKLRFALIPAVTLWNPHNVPIVMEGGQTHAQQIVVKPPPIAIIIRKRGADGAVFQTRQAMNMAFMVAGMSETRADVMRLNFARNEPLVFQPGEVRVFSASVTGDYYTFLSSGQYHSPQSLNSQKNLVDAVPGWNADSALQLRNSANRNGIARATIHPQNANTLLEQGGNAYLARQSHTLNQATDEFEFAIYVESPENTSQATGVTSRGTAPHGSAFSFYMAQRIFSSSGGSNGYGFLNLRKMGLTSRYGMQELPALFNSQLLNQGAATIELGTAMEPIRAENIVGATEAGESLPIVQFALMAGCETSELANGGIFSGRKSPSRPFLHSSPLQANFIDQVDPTAPYNHGWNWWLDEMNSLLEAMVQESQSGNGFYGGGYTAESGATHVVQQEIPVAPPLSIAALSHARIGGFTLANEAPAAHGLTGLLMEGSGSSGAGHVGDPRPTLGFQRVTATGQGGLYPHVLQAIGNSYANPNLDAGVAFNPAWTRHYSQDLGERNVVFADHSYLANKALWDEYFFSSITPQPSAVEIFGGSGREAREVAEDFFFNGQPLPNRRIAPYLANLSPSDLAVLFATKDDPAGGLADQIASHLMVEGAFNINSTSVDAWKVFFSSLKGKPVAYLDGGKSPAEADAGNNMPVGMGSLPIGPPATTADTVNARDPLQWKGMRLINEDEIDALAQAMVREVKKRGPFLSLSEFVNRRLDPDNTDGMALKGALQAALDYDGSDELDPEVTINRNFRDISRTLDSEVGDIDFAFSDAARGPAAYGSSAYVDQADVLRHFAEQISPRGDTFVIRTYGDSLDAQGNVVARAWCEAVVQRTPDYVDPSDDNHLKTAELSSEANRRFGRSLQIISLRWLNANEI